LSLNIRVLSYLLWAISQFKCIANKTINQVNCVTKIYFHSNVLSVIFFIKIMDLSQRKTLKHSHHGEVKCKTKNKKTFVYRMHVCVIFLVERRFYKKFTRMNEIINHKVSFLLLLVLLLLLLQSIERGSRHALF
jgi:hypothetical protein